MQHPLQISRKIEYGLRAMAFLAAHPEGEQVSAAEISRRMRIPSEFLAKILKTLVQKQLVRSTRGAHGGYGLAKPARGITFLDVIEAVEGPVIVNLCQGAGHDTHDGHGGCKVSSACSMYSVWKWGQQRMLEVFRQVTLDQIAMKELHREHPALAQLGMVTTTPQ